MKQYFYGPHNNLFPHSFEVTFAEIKGKLFKVQIQIQNKSNWQSKQIQIGAPELPDSCIPLGVSIADNKTKLVAVNPNPRLDFFKWITGFVSLQGFVEPGAGRVLHLRHRGRHHHQRRGEFWRSFVFLWM